MKYLRSSVPAILLVLCLLGLQAWCDLELPGYTSKIVTEGLQQKGVEDNVPERMSAQTMEDVKLFTDADVTALLGQDYVQDEDGNWVLGDISASQRSQLAEGMLIPEIFVYMLSHPEVIESYLGSSIEAESETPAEQSGQTGDSSGSGLSGLLSQAGSLASRALVSSFQEKLTAGEDLMPTVRKLPSTVLNSLLSQAEEKLRQMPDTITGQIGVLFVQNEYQSLGEDLDRMQIDYLKQIGGQMLLIALLAMACTVLAQFLVSRLAARTSRDIRRDVYRKVMSFHSQEFNQFSTASLITRSTNDIQQVQQLLSIGLRLLLYAPIMAIGGIMKVVRTDVSMSWIIALAVAVILILIFTLFRVAMPKFTSLQKLIDRLNLVTREQLTGVMVTRAFSAETHEEERFEKANEDLTKTNLFVNRCMTFMMPIMMLVLNGVSVLIVFNGAHGVDNGTLQVGDMMAFIQYAMQIIMAFLMISVISVLIPRANVAANRIAQVLNTEVVIHDPDTPKHPDPSVKGEVVFDHVTFAYPEAEGNVLTDITFSAHRGETVAFIGSTGSGKSTLINLIPRFFDVTGGSVRVDGVDVRDYAKEELDAKLGYVPQKSILFSGTIDSNIRFGCPDAPQEQVRQAARIAQAEEFIEEKGDKYQSRIAQGGSNVSGGQRQRLSIARAIAKKPEILIFDDSFSALDFKTDAALRKALKENTKDTTVLIVAQRISTILQADRIVVLDEGKVAGIGTHRELLKNCTVYHQIAVSQLSEEELA